MIPPDFGDFFAMIFSRIGFVERESFQKCLELRFTNHTFCPDSSIDEFKNCISDLVFASSNHAVIEKQKTHESTTEQARRCTPRKANMTMENPPFEDVFPIENRDVPMSC